LLNVDSFFINLPYERLSLYANYEKSLIENELISLAKADLELMCRCFLRMILKLFKDKTSMEKKEKMPERFK